MGIADVHAAAEGSLPGPAVACHGLVDDDDQRAIGAIMRREIAACDEGNAEGVEVVAVDQSKGGKSEAPAGRGLAFNGIGGQRVVAISGKRVADPCADHRRARGEAVEHGVIEIVGGGLRRVLLERQLIAGDEHVLGLEAGVDGEHSAIAAQEDAGGCEEKQGDGDFRDDEAGAEPGVTGRSGAAARAVLQGVDDVGAGGSENGSDAAESAGGDGQNESKKDDGRIHGDGVDAGQGFRQKMQRGAYSDDCQAQADATAGKAQEQAGEHRLAEDGAGRSTQCDLHSVIAATADGADQQESGDVGAGDDEHDQHGKEESAQNRPGVRDGLIAEGEDIAANPDGGHGCGEVAHHLLRDARDVFNSLPGGDAIFHARDHPVAPRACVLIGQLFRGEAERNPDLCLVEAAGNKGELKAARHDADDGVRATIENDGLANHTGVAMIAVEPQGVADDGDGRVGVVFLTCENAPEDGCDAESGEDVCAKASSGEQLRSGGARQLVACGGESADGGEGAGCVLVSGNFARRDADAGSVANVIADQNEAIGIGERQRPQKNAFDEREDGNRGAHAQRQRENGGEVEHWGLTHLANGETKVLEHGAAPRDCS